MTHQSKVAVLTLAILIPYAVVFGTMNFRLLRTADAQQPALDGFLIDESVGGPRPIPKIPNSWHFVGISNGEKMNSNTLWFQDKEGTIYMVQGFTSSGEFILDQRIQKLGSTR